MKTKEYVRPMPATWWLHNRHLVLFMIRELTSVFIAGYAVFLMVMLYRANHPGPESHQWVLFEKALQTPLSIVLHAIVLVFALFHSITWFNLTPKAMVLWNGEERVSPYLIAGAHYGLWAIVSLVVLIVGLTV